MQYGICQADEDMKENVDCSTKETSKIIYI